MTSAGIPAYATDSPHAVTTDAGIRHLCQIGTRRRLLRNQRQPSHSCEGLRHTAGCGCGCCMVLLVVLLLMVACSRGLLLGGVVVIVVVLLGFVVLVAAGVVVYRSICMARMGYGCCSCSRPAPTVLQPPAVRGRAACSRHCSQAGSTAPSP